MFIEIIIVLKTSHEITHRITTNHLSLLNCRVLMGNNAHQSRQYFFNFQVLYSQMYKLADNINDQKDFVKTSKLSISSMFCRAACRR